MSSEEVSQTPQEFVDEQNKKLEEELSELKENNKSLPKKEQQRRRQQIQLRSVELTLKDSLKALDERQKEELEAVRARYKQQKELLHTSLKALSQSVRTLDSFKQNPRGVVERKETTHTPDGVLSKLVGKEPITRSQALSKLSEYMNNQKKKHSLKTHEEVRQKDRKLQAFISDSQLRKYIEESNKNKSEDKQRDSKTLELKQSDFMYFIGEHLKE